MCVIYACGTKLPPEDELRRGAFKNDDGAGVCWLDKSKKRVRWVKGLKDEKAVLEVIEKHKIPFPLAIHFRTASVGGKTLTLTHPFPVAQDVPLFLEGTAGEVLMHNGHLSNWDDLVLKAGIASQEQFPEGDWSDSRALAWLAYLKGHGIIRFINQTSRVMIMSAEPQWEPDAEGDPWVYFSFWGSWEGTKADGFVQSIKTEYYNKGGVIVHRGSTWNDYDITGDDDDVPAAAEKLKATACGTSIENVWTIQELADMLLDMEQELENARTAARA